MGYSDTMSTTVGVFLKNQLDLRSRKRTSYTLRAFARDLEVSSSWLSRILNGTRGISALRASQLSKRLHLSPSEEEYFIKLAESQFSRSRLKKASAQKELESWDNTHVEMADDQMCVLSNWNHFAIPFMRSFWE